MEELRKVLLSPVWWVSVVIVGIVINIIAYYFRRFIDAQLSKISKRWRIRSEEKNKARVDFIERLSTDKHEATVSLIKAVVFRVGAVHFLLVALFLQIACWFMYYNQRSSDSSYFVFLVMAFYFLFNSIRDNRRGKKIWEVFLESQDADNPDDL